MPPQDRADHKSTLRQGNLILSGIKLFPEAMLMEIYVVAWHHLAICVNETVYMGIELFEQVKCVISCNRNNCQHPIAYRLLWMCFYKGGL